MEVTFRPGFEGWLGFGLEGIERKVNFKWTEQLAQAYKQ